MAVDVRRACFAAGVISIGGLWVWWRRHSTRHASSTAVARGLQGLIGDTPLMELRTVSALTGCRVLAKAEHLSPGGSVKDRVAMAMVLAAEGRGELTPGQPGVVVAATRGNTGIGLALMAASRGYRCVLTVPDTTDQHTLQLLRTLGAEVIRCPAVPPTDERHYIREAQRAAQQTAGAALLSACAHLHDNSSCHHDTTAPEILRQTDGLLDAFVCAGDTGGALAGVARYLRSRAAAVRVYRVDPPSVDSDRDSDGSVDGVFTATEREVAEMSHYLVRNEGLFVGRVAAANVCGAVKAARALGPGRTVVTLLCDSGDRYRSTLYSREWLEHGCTLTHSDHRLDFITAK